MKHSSIINKLEKKASRSKFTVLSNRKSNRYFSSSKKLTMKVNISQEMSRMWCPLATPKPRVSQWSST